MILTFALEGDRIENPVKTAKMQDPTRMQQDTVAQNLEGTWKINVVRKPVIANRIINMSRFFSFSLVVAVSSWSIVVDKTCPRPKSFSSNQSCFSIVLLKIGTTREIITKLW